MHVLRPAIDQLLLTRSLRPRALRLLAFSSFPDLEPATTLLRGALRGLHRDLQNAVAESRIGLIGIDALRQRDAPIEAAVTALCAVVAPLILFVLLPAFTPNHE